MSNEQERKAFEARIGDHNNHFTVRSYGWDVDMVMYQGFETKNRVYQSVELSPDDARCMAAALRAAADFSDCARAQREQERAA